MKFEVDGIKFDSEQKHVDELIDEVIFSYSLERIGAYNTQIVCDSEEMVSYIVDRFLEKRPEFHSYDLGQNRTDGLLELSELIQTTPLLVYGFERYMSFLQTEYFANKTALVCGKEYMEAQKRVYTAIELRRDSLFCAFKTKVIFVFSDKEYNAFINLADDFVSYYPENFDFNKTFVSENDEFGNLFEYLNYYKKGLKVASRRLTDDKKNSKS